MKSLCNSAPFWKTLSGVSTLGRPVSEMVTEASLLRVLSSNLRSFSAIEGVAGGGFSELVVFGFGISKVEVFGFRFGGKTEVGGFGSETVGLVEILGNFSELGLGGAKEEEFEALFSWIGEEFFCGRTLKFSRSK